MTPATSSPPVSTTELNQTARVRPEIPESYPAWTRELADLYFGGSTCLFILHGNVHDLVRCTDGEERFISLTEFLATEVFGSWDIVLGYDLARGFRALAGSDRKRLQKMIGAVSGWIGDITQWPGDPDKALAAIDQMVDRNLIVEQADQRKRMAFVFEQAQFLVPAGDLAMQARGHASRLVRLLAWAKNPYIKRVNAAFCLVADRLSEVSERLVQNPHVAAIEIPMPDAPTRAAFIKKTVAANGAAGDQREIDNLVSLSSGLNLVSLEVALSRTSGQGSAAGLNQFRQMKRDLIERQCQGLVSFVEPSFTLDAVVGQDAAKARLKQDAQWLAEGRLDSAPMGYLLSGPVGTGKTFLAECYAGSIGIPCVTLRNFRSKYVGETEGNLEQVLNVLRSLGPVVVIVDEADAALGNRQAEGDSGTSARVFSMIASQMGNTKFRGRIMWMLLTSRPDLLPVDLKRQGRAEVHIPLFYPQDAEELKKMFRAMAGKNKLKMAEDAVPDVSAERGLSGADVESILLGAWRNCLAAGRSQVERADLAAAVADFIPASQGLEKEMQELVSVLECTDRTFLPPRWRDKVAEVDGRTRLQERAAAIRQLLEE